MSQEELRIALQESAKVMQDVAKLVKESNLDLRVTVILHQSALDYYITHSVELQFKTDKFQKVGTDTKLASLRDIGIIDEDLQFNLTEISRIRHLFAHKIQIDDNEVLNILKRIRNNPTNLDSTALNIRDKYIISIANSLRGITLAHDHLLVTSITG